VAPGATESGWK